jgi:hypothetical protein
MKYQEMVIRTLEFIKDGTLDPDNPIHKKIYESENDYTVDVFLDLIFDCAISLYSPMQEPNVREVYHKELLEAINKGENVNEHRILKIINDITIAAMNFEIDNG